MKKLDRRSKLFVLILAILMLFIASIAFIPIRQSKQCYDIIGDGYSMGTDSEPVVIGNTCDG